MRSFAKVVFVALSLIAFAGCNGEAVAPGLAGFPEARTVGDKVGPGKIVSTQDGGQIFGYDVDQNGHDGVLASAKQVATNAWTVSVETFDTRTANVTKSFAIYTGPRNSYQVDGIFDKDVALVTHFVVPKNSIYAKRYYEIMNPVTAEKFTGKWQPPIKDLSVLQHAENQSTTTSVVYAIELKNQDVPDLVVSDLAKKKSAKIIHLNPNTFALVASPQLSQDTLHNLAVMATSPDGGAAGGPPPEIETVDLSSGKLTEFSGVSCPGLAGCGDPNGIAFDSGTGVACTTTEIDAGVEFYDVAQKSGFRVGLPNAGQYNAGTYVASDPIHKLFLVAQPESSTSTGSSIQVYDESGNLVESINGLNFTFDFYLAVPITIAIDPATRTGWVNGPNVTQLQEFSY
jgi:hypothetical protein